MEVIVFLVVLVVFLIAFYVKGALDEKNRKRRFMEELRKNYGKPRMHMDNPERYANLGQYYEKHKTGYAVDDITWNDLAMDQVYSRVNYTHSACGEEYLYYRLRCPEQMSGEEALSVQEEALIRYLQEHEKERVELQMQFSQIGYTGKYSLYQYLEFLENLGERNNKKHYAALAAYLLTAGIAVFAPSVGITAALAVMIYQIFSYLKERGENEPYLVSFSFILRFIAGAQNLLQSGRVQNNGTGKQSDLQDYLSGMQEHIKNLRSITRHSLFLNGENSNQGDPLSIVSDYLKMITHVNLIEFNRMLLAVRASKEELDRLYTKMGYLEYLLCVGEYRKSLPWYCVPEFDEHTGIKCEKLYHPLIEQAVACSFSEDRGILVTGSNASGKSTFLKSVAVNVILSQAMHTALAENMKLAHYRIYSSMALRDDLDSGDSYYMVEIRALKRIIDAIDNGQNTAGNRILCFVDEVLRGTNTVERIAASTQIMKYFYDRNVFCFAATHDIELTHLLQDEYHNFHFEEDVTDGDIHFNYELREGRATTRNAIKLLEIMGYEKRIIDEAQNMAAEFVRTGKWRESQS